MPNIINKTNDQKDAEAEVDGFKEDLGPFVVAAETTRMPMVFTDACQSGDPIIFANDSFLKLTGYPREEVLGQPFCFIIDKAADAGAIHQIEDAFATRRDDDPEVQCRCHNGTSFWATIFINPVEDDDGSVVQHFVSLVDVTRHRRAQTHADMLIEELNHRVKNTLATVQSIVTQAVRHQTDPQIIRESIESRIGALSRSHDVLSREKWTGARLNDLVQSALEPLGISNGRMERFTIEGENIVLSPKAALALGIAFHELATNAVKYGAFSNEAGSVAISWTLTTDAGVRWLCLYWRESGGPIVVPPARRGFGSRVIEQGLAHELNGSVRLDYNPEGIVCTIDVPAPQAVVDG